ncbi:hypothetical protein NC653_038965 [Populus alba x Populus x berolinensis]|uniref:Uncharacterized protein n=1 Tax=Populus alba x Populus x berolinensis TaxID=444605 RepID=A0AAD6PPV0_9ROSI|nr:hypothetical protein NC653_038965 [Populus alba x Populus x berolinensis]
MNMIKPLLLLDINTRFDQFDAKFGTQKNQQEQMQQADADTTINPGIGHVSAGGGMLGQSPHIGSPHIIPPTHTASQRHHGGISGNLGRGQNHVFGVGHGLAQMQGALYRANVAGHNVYPSGQSLKEGMLGEMRSYAIGVMKLIVRIIRTMRVNGKAKEKTLILKCVTPAD